MRIFKLSSRIAKIFVLIVLVSVFGCNDPASNNKAYAYLKKAAEIASKSCPVQVDSLLKLENVTAFTPATLRYNYSIKIDTAIYDLDKFRNDLAVTTRNIIRTGPDSKVFRSLFTTFEYYYRDIHGNFLFRFAILPEDYLNREDLKIK